MFPRNNDKEKFSTNGNAKLFNFTFGNIAFAAFIIAAVSGILLAIPFDINKPYDSIAYILLTNPGGVLFRNLHYWSAQLFLIFSILHLYDHLKRSTERELRSGVWLRLTFSIIVIFFVMLSGFIIKGDADSIQARQIISTLIEQIPLIGKELSISLLGSGKSYQLIYVHHIATATIFLWVIIIEHAKFIWPRLRIVLYLLPLLILIGYIFPPALHDGLNPVIKGPWYFLGLQEILHWLSYPFLAVIIAFIFLIAVFLLPKLPLTASRLTKQGILISAIVYTILIIIGFYFRGTDWQFTWPWNNPVITEYHFQPFEGIKTVSDKELESRNIPVVLGRREGCLFCHNDVNGFSPAHNPQAIGCVSCHLGNPFSLDKNDAHSGMILIPGNLNTAKRTCGTSNCHSNITDRIQNTLMTTLSGMISVDRYTFGESDSLNSFHRISNIDHSLAYNHLRNLCASCHLCGIKKETGPITQLSRGGGCNACHLNYDKKSLNALNTYKRTGYVAGDTSKPLMHPSLSVKINDGHCFGCHSRSGRISTNYEGWRETFLAHNQVDTSKGFRILEDGRVFAKTQDDVHHAKGMSCIDCHTSYETMGNGNVYLHEEDQTQVRCADCHFNGKPKTISYKQLDAESQKIAELRKYNQKDRRFLTIKKSGCPLINTYINKDNKPELITKNGNKTLPLQPPSFVCTEGKGHENLSCKSCHTSWSPQCIGCHTQYNPDGESYDLLDNKYVKGAWEETPSDYLAEPPVLGVRTTVTKSGMKKETVETFIPGMILTIKKKDINPNSKSDKNLIFRRMYAPAFSHTITKQSRSCQSCHNNPLAIGYGRGKLEYVKVGKFGRWKFTPKYPLSYYDALPEDAWIGFLRTRMNYAATRTNVRPFNVEEQKNILTVGACLTCHKQNSRPIKLFLLGGKMPKVSSKCLLPRWD